MDMQPDYSSEITASSEDRRREFKCSAPWDTLRAKIARAAMAMANTRGGGLIILGIQDSGHGCSALGLAPDHLSSYKDDDIKDFVNAYADPYVECSIHRPEMDRKRFIVIDVAEFSELPIICKKPCNDTENNPILRAGGVYVRSFQKPESRLVQSHSEMRELYDLAVERGMRKFLSRAQRASLSVQVQPTDAEQFEQERVEFQKRLAACKRFSNGYYRVSVRPSVYNPKTVEPITRIFELASQFQVRYQGWRFPYISPIDEGVEERSAGTPREPNERGNFWRMFQSGHFLWADDYRESRSLDPYAYLFTDARKRAIEAEVSGFIDFHRLIIIATQAYEFAAGLASHLHWEPSVEIAIALTNTAKRALVSYDVSAPVYGLWQTMSENVESRRMIDVASLVSSTRSLAADAVRDIAMRFAGREAELIDVESTQRQFSQN